jgi:hypothetical protein
MLRRFDGHLGILAIIAGALFTVFGGAAIQQLGRRIVYEGS